MILPDLSASFSVVRQWHRSERCLRLTRLLARIATNSPRGQKLVSALRHAQRIARDRLGYHAFGRPIDRELARYDRIVKILDRLNGRAEFNPILQRRIYRLSRTACALDARICSREDQFATSLHA